MWKIPITYTFNPIYILNRVITVLNMFSMGFEVLNIGLIHENPIPLSLLLTHVDKSIEEGIEPRFPPFLLCSQPRLDIS